MRKSAFYFLLVFSTIFIVACEEEPPDPPVGQTSKLDFTLTQDSISYRMIKFNFDVENFELNSIDELGICYGNEPNPTTEQNTAKIEPPRGTGSLQIGDLQPNTEYNARLYAKLGDIDIYGANNDFQTKQLGMPTVTTTEATDITENSATTGGNITDDGGSAITARGVCWSTSTNPTLDDNSTTDGTGMGSYTSHINGLTQGNIYYVRAYATNNAGEAYGNQVSFEATSFPDESLVAYYKFDGDASDATGNGNDGTVNGATLTNGKIGECYSFDGVDNWINLNSSFNYETFTFTAWIKINDFSESNHIYINNGTGSCDFWSYQINTNNYLISNAACQGTDYTSSLQITKDQWSHIVFVLKKDGDAIMFSDNQKESIPSNNIEVNKTNLKMISNSDGKLKGLIDEIGIWNCALTSEEVEQLYNNGNGLQYTEDR